MRKRKKDHRTLTIPAGEKQMTVPDKFVVTTQDAYNYAASKFLIWEKS